MPEPPKRTPIANSPLSLILVARNSAGDFQLVVNAWIAQLEELNLPWELILVDDGSTDETPALADDLVSHHDRIRITHLPMQMGFGAALRTGIDTARYPLVAYCTCDRQYEPADLKLLFAQIDKVDLVTGYRRWLPVPPPLRWLGRIWRTIMRILIGVSLEPLPTWLGDYGQRNRWIARWLFGVRVCDVDCALRLFRREILTRMPIQSHGPFVQAEMLAKANFLGCLIAETQVAYHATSSPALHGSLNPRETYLSEACGLLRKATFASP